MNLQKHEGYALQEVIHLFKNNLKKWFLQSTVIYKARRFIFLFVFCGSDTQEAEV